MNSRVLLEKTNHIVTENKERNPHMVLISGFAVKNPNQVSWPRENLLGMKCIYQRIFKEKLGENPEKRQEGGMLN